MSFLRRFGARGASGGEVPSEAFTRDLFSSRLARLPIAAGLLVAGVAVAYAWNSVSAAVGWIALVLGAIGIVVGVVILDRGRWRGQEVLLWQQAGRDRRWRDETGGPSPNEHPAQAETWLGSHPRGSVPPLYRVMAAALTRDQVVYQQELAAWVPATPTDAAWRAWAITAPRAMEAADADLGGLRAAAASLPEGDDRRQLTAGLAVAESLRRHHLRDATWLDPLLAVRRTLVRERVRARQLARVWFGRLGILLGFVVPALALTASGVGAQEPFPRSYLQTQFATRGDVGELDDLALLSALPALARDIAGSAPLGLSPLTVDGFNRTVDAGLPTLLWYVDEIDVPPPTEIACEHVWSIEALLGDAATEPWAVVTCDDEHGPAWLVPIDPATIAALRSGVGLQP